MPTLSKFHGIFIRMYWKDVGKHKAPHFHAFYNEYEAIFRLDGDIIEGAFPRKQCVLVKTWALLYEEDLVKNWSLAINGEETYKIEPLK